MPPTLAGAGLVWPREGAVGSGQPTLNAALKAALAWLTAVAEVGGANDVQLAWEQWHDTSLGGLVKRYLESELERLKAQAGQRHAELLRQAEEEQQGERVLAGMLAELKRAKKHAAEILSEYQRACVGVACIKQAIADLERGGPLQ